MKSIGPNFFLEISELAVGAALQNRSQDFFSLLIFIYLVNMKPLSEVAPGLLVIQISIQAVCFAFLQYSASA